jgi:SAM-dependent MidA family methyltransferase
MQAEQGHTQGHTAGLPDVDSESLRHSRRVADFIGGKIDEAGGSVSFAEFMHHALYAPGLGYYAAGSVKFGADGDFVTAPEVSPLFAAVLARQCAELLGQLDDACVLEIGAGSGVLAAGLLRSLQRLGELPKHYLILEVSADLQQRQERLLKEQVPDLCDRVRWLAELPRSFRGVMIANEVADALPVERFAIQAGEPVQIRVSTTHGGFEWCNDSAPETLRKAIRGIERDIGTPFQDGYVSEVSLSLPTWIGELCDCLQEGAMLLFDYGLSCRELYAADRTAGWLRCHFRHRAHNNPLINVGIQDLTCWVDFSAIATAAAEKGLQIDGFVTQAAFLMNGGIQEELTDFTDLPERQQIQLSRELKLLTLPGEMGENFKCLGVSRGELQAASAFLNADRAHTL